MNEVSPGRSWRTWVINRFSFKDLPGISARARVAFDYEFFGTLAQIC